MSAESLPESFVMDAEGELAVALSEDVGMALIDIGFDMEGDQCGRIVEQAARIVVPATSELDTYKRAAFRSAGAMACHAFARSDAPEIMRQRTLRLFAQSGIPLGLATEEHSTAVINLEMMTLTAQSNHPELNHHIDMVGRHYASSSQCADLSWTVQQGAGFTVFQLDQSWQRVRAVMMKRPK